MARVRLAGKEFSTTTRGDWIGQTKLRIRKAAKRDREKEKAGRKAPAQGIRERSGCGRNAGDAPTSGGITGQGLSGPASVRIWVDADACPNAIKEILFRAADRNRVQVTLVANAPLRIPPSPFIATLQVPHGFDVADNRIVELADTGDLVVTADIPLAAGVIGKGAFALDPRGETYTKDNIGERLSTRKFMDELRSNGVETGGPAAFGNADRQAFASRLDKFLASHRDQ